MIDLAFRVSVAGQNITERVRPILEELTVVDSAGTVSDTASLILNDQGGMIAMPSRGADLSISLPLAGSPVEVFRGTVDDVRSRYDRGSGLKLQIDAKGMDTREGLKAPREHHWDEMDLGSVMEAAGGLAGLSVQVHDSLAAIRRDWWAMDGESILAFGWRIGREVGATFKIVGSLGILTPRSAGLSAAGKLLSTIEARRGVNLISADLAPEYGRPRFKRARARYYDLDAARYRTKDIEFEDGAGADQLLPDTSADEDGAESAARSEKDESERAKGGGRVEIVGSPRATPEGTCEVAGIRAGVDGSYTIESVGHSLTRSRGYITALDLIKPGSGVGTDDR